MAIESPVSTPHGLMLDGGYVRIDHILATATECVVDVDVYASAAARSAGAMVLEHRRYMIDPATITGPIWPALYSYLKSLPEYAGAVDC